MTTRHAIVVGMVAVILTGLLPAGALAAYFSPVMEVPPPCLKEYDISTPILYSNGILVRNLVATRTSLGAALPPENTHAGISSFFDIFTEISVDGGGTWSNGLDHDCDSFFDIFTEVMDAGGAGGAGGAQSMNGMNIHLSVPAMGQPVMIRESPTRASTGRFDMTGVSGGYMCDSFFDIFTEISVDGGMTWAEQTNGPTRMVGVPEPVTLLMLTLGGWAVMQTRRRWV